MLDRLGLLLYRRELLGEALNGVAEQPSLGDGGGEKACLVFVLHLCQVEPEMALLDHHGGHRLPEGPRRDFRRSQSEVCRRAQLLHQPRVGTTLVHLFKRLGLVNLQNLHERLLAVKGREGSSCTSGKKDTGAGRGCEPRPLRETNHPAVRARDWAVC